MQIGTCHLTGALLQQLTSNTPEGAQGGEQK